MIRDLEHIVRIGLEVRRRAGADEGRWEGGGERARSTFHQRDGTRIARVDVLERDLDRPVIGPVVVRYGHRHVVTDLVDRNRDGSREPATDGVGGRLGDIAVARRRKGIEIADGQRVAVRGVDGAIHIRAIRRGAVGRVQRCREDARAGGGFRQRHGLGLARDVVVRHDDIERGNGGQVRVLDRDRYSGAHGRRGDGRQPIIAPDHVVRRDDVGG